MFDLERFAPSVVHLEFYCLPLSERIEIMERLAANGYAWGFLERDLLAVRLDAASTDFCLARNGILS